jgi:catechol 2,3-dioxygenase-like lactoylglutathione lyase family enzyme
MIPAGGVIMTDQPRMLSVLPALVVPDVRAAAAYYRDVLGFRLPDDHGGAEEFAIVDLAPGQGIHLKRGAAADGRVMGAYLRVTQASLAATASALERQGVALTWPLTDQPWQMRELAVTDPYRHLIRWGAELDPDRDRERAAGPRTCPEIPVEDVPGAIAFCRDVLGFAAGGAADHLPYFAIARREGVTLHFTRDRGATATRNRPRAGIWDLCIEASGVEGLARELRARGAAVGRGPVVTGYGMRELEIEGPEGITVCFAEDAEGG